MHSLRKWFYKPKKDDTSKLAMFYWADEEMTMVTTELDSFDGRTDPVRCSILVTQLRFCQDKVLSICNGIMDEAIPDIRANRDFRAKFPDDVLHDNLSGQLWFGAECLAAGSNIIHREVESAMMRPLAKAFTRSLENVRCLLREQSLRNVLEYSPKVKDALRIFDRLFAEFELCYVSTMVPIKSAKEYHLQQEIVVLFSETLIRGLKMKLIDQEMVDDYDPALMFTIPRLAIVWGFLIFTEGPFNVDRDADNMSELFRPFCSLLHKIRDLLWTLTRSELSNLEKMLCSLEEPKIEEKVDNQEIPFPSAEDYVSKFRQNEFNSKQFIQDFYSHNFGVIVDEAGNQLVSQNDDNQNVIVEQPVNCKKSKSKSKNVRSRPTHGRAAEQRESDISGLVSSSYDSHANKGSFSSPCGSAQNVKLESTKSYKSSLEKFASVSLSKRDSHRRRSKYGCSCISGREVSPSSEVLMTENLSHEHSQCNCFGGKLSRRRCSSRRLLMHHLKGHRDVVSLGHPSADYVSSPEASPKIYRPASHSFPIHCYDNAPKSPRPSSRSSFQCRYVHHQSPISRSWNCDNCRSVTPEDGWDLARRNSPALPIPGSSPCKEQSYEVTYSSCSSCQSISSISSTDWNSSSPDTSSYNSECQDDEEIALALQAAEIASRNKPRSRFKSSTDLLHKLFVCISGVADQLQTNYASDLRNILKSVFDMNCSQTSETSSINSPATSLPQNETSIVVNNDNNYSCGDVDNAQQSESQSPGESHNYNMFSNPMLNFDRLTDDERDRSSVDSAEEAIPDSPTSLDMTDENDNPSSDYRLGPPAWLPDEWSSCCMACDVSFTILRRRHHCRNCGKIFCSQCSTHMIVLPHFGHIKPVRVCNQCFDYQLNNIVIQQAAT